MHQERLALLALHLLPGVGSYTIRQLISYVGQASTIFDTPRNKLLRIPGVGPSIAGAVLDGANLEKAQKIMEKAARRNVELLFHTDPGFPRRLLEIPDCPTLLFCRGRNCLDPVHSVAVVGTRRATSYGLGMTRELVSGLARHKPLIVSGLAYGIDAEAHRVALENDLQTAAIMAGGIEYIYPAAHRQLSRNIEAQGALVTENGIDSVPDATRFPARNRIIAGLCDVVLVIEAAERGGALITAAIANDYSREVMAVPGNIGQRFSEGCNHLIKRHRAHLLTRTEDIEYLMNWNTNQLPADLPRMPPLTNEESQLMETLVKNEEPVHLDRLSWALGLTVGKTASLLLQLEFKGLVKALPGKQFTSIRPFHQNQDHSTA